MTDALTVISIVAGLSPVANKLLLKALGPAAAEIGEQLKIKAHGYLARNRETVLNRAGVLAEETGKVAHEIPLRVLLPLLEGASRENEASLQEMWAELIAHAATADDPDDVPPSYAAILSQLSPLDARVLLSLWSKTIPAPFDKSFAYSRDGKGVRGAVVLPDLSALTGIKDLQRLAASLDLLVSHGLAAEQPLLRAGDTWDDNDLYNDGVEFRITALGERFVAACSPGRVTVPAPFAPER